MERKEKWESLRLGAQKFAPQEFVAACELIIDKYYEIDPNGLVQGVHVKWDALQDHLYTVDDSHEATETSKTTHATHMYYKGLGWGINAHGQITWPSDVTESHFYTEAEMKDQYGIGMFFLLVEHENDDPAAGGVKVFAGDEIERVIKNAS